MSDDEKNFNENKIDLNSSSNELFDEESYTPHTLINVRRVKLPNNGENWEILKDGEVVLVLKGLKLSKKEKNYLYTPEGLMTLIQGYKDGCKSFLGFKKILKSKIDD